MIKECVASIAVIAIAACSNNATNTAVRATPLPGQDSSAVAMSRKIRSEHVLSVRYAGKWNFVSHRTDGRFQGESARSFHTGDSITIAFEGNRLRIFGIRGKNGGLGTIVIPGKPLATLDFYSPAKETHVLLYDSGLLKGTIQTAGIVVATPRPPRLRGYVNIDELEASSQQP